MEKLRIGLIVFFSCMFILNYLISIIIKICDNTEEANYFLLNALIHLCLVIFNFLLLK